MRILFLQLPLPTTIHEPEEAQPALAAALLLSHAASQGRLAGVEATIFPAELACTLGDQALIERILDARPDVLGLSIFMWNVDRSLALARTLKQRLPGLRVFLGGPEVTLDNARLLAAPGWDGLAVGEGERTFLDLLDLLREGAPTPAAAPPGLVLRRPGAEGLLVGPPARLLDSLDTLRPYQGWFPVPRGQEALLETARGCSSRCRYCYYPKAHPRRSLLSRDMVREQVRLLRAGGARGVYLLDPTLTDRPDLPALLELLAEEGGGELAFFGELEVGLQSVNPRALRQVGRRLDRAKLVAGLAALRDVGIRPTLDLIVGLPGDTPAGVRESLLFVHEQGLAEHVQVFTLSLLPGTPLRQSAASLGLKYQSDPPYQVEETPAFGPADLEQALDLGEELLETELDAVPLPLLAPLPGGLSRLEDPLPEGILASHTLWCAVPDPLVAVPAMAQRAAALLTAEPFCTLGIVIETGQPFPFDVYDRLLAALAPWNRRYLDLLHGRRSTRASWSCRLVSLLPWARRTAATRAWMADGCFYADPVWQLPAWSAEELLGRLPQLELEPWETVRATVVDPPLAELRLGWLRELSWALAEPQSLVFGEVELQRAWAGMHTDRR